MTAFIIFLIVLSAIIAVEIPVFVTGKREEDLYVLTASGFAVAICILGIALS